MTSLRGYFIISWFCLHFGHSHISRKQATKPRKEIKTVSNLPLKKQICKTELWTIQYFYFGDMAEGLEDYTLSLINTDKYVRKQSH